MPKINTGISFKLFSVKIIIAIFLGVFLGGCQKSPGDECLHSFRTTLKDPDSGKVIDFKDSILTYTATNTYGARTQGKAICYKTPDGKWERSRGQEYIQILQLVTKKLAEMNECQKIGNKPNICFGGSAALERAYKTNTLGTDQLVEDLRRESEQELGF